MIIILKTIDIGLFKIVVMPFWCWYKKSGCNLNDVDVFDSWQIGCLELWKFKSKECLDMWNAE